MSGMVARLDDWGKPAWIAAMIAGFVLFWPIGLLILGYMIWSGRMGCNSQWGAWGENRRARWEQKMERMREKMDRWSAYRDSAAGSGFRPTGNRAFDEYRSETIRRLEEEATQFRDYLERLRHAKDKAEFDRFMEDRRNRKPAEGPDEPEPRPAM
ncbi:MAG: DUF2852 domain-containing protein [Beijerinckiaceae bacterium]|nr:DUF2852 domain-containing protein [Beijerinckiaceae bacterium]MCZ8301117.1 DUF2852 domain-containing protein [Beijerinckiaceae bacterium]